MKNITQNIQLGFSLIEIITSVTFISLLLGLGTLNVLNAKHKASLSAAVDSFITDVKEQQLKTMAGDTEGSGTTNNYGIDLETNTYTFFRNSYTQGNQSNFVVTLPDTIQITNTFPSNQIIFASGSGELVNYSSNANSLIFKDTTNTDQKTIQFNRYGVITGIN